MKREFLERDVKNIFLPAPDAQVYFVTSSPSHHGRRSSGVRHLGCSIAVAASSLVATTPISFETHGKPCGCMVATMDLSEARGLVLFRVVRRGIGISRRLSVTDTLSAYRRLGCSPSNPSVSRTNRPPPEKESAGDGKGSSPETLKRLAISVSRRRSFLPSSTEST